jgi:hypothetical protein
MNSTFNFRKILFAAAFLPVVACTNAPSQTTNVVSGAEIQAAVATCNEKYVSRELTSLVDVAKCEQQLALPEALRQQPSLAGLYVDVWSEKVDLYARVDRGELTKAEADRKFLIDLDNRLSIVQSLRRTI